MGVVSAPIPQSKVSWRPAHRLVPSRFPPVGLWDRVADATDFDALAEIEGLTNPRIREELGRLDLVPPRRRVYGQGTTPIMAAFTHFDQAGNRFSDGTFGVFYAAHTLTTAIEETKYHRAKFLAYTKEPAIEITMRCYTMDIQSDFHDIRGGRPDVHDPNSYVASRQLGTALRAEGSNGIVYSSVRDPGGECVAAFWPDQVGSCTQSQHFAYYWDGQRISHVFQKTLIE